MSSLRWTILRIPKRRGAAAAAGPVGAVHPHIRPLPYHRCAAATAATGPRLAAVDKEECESGFSRREKSDDIGYLPPQPPPASAQQLP